MKRTTLKRFCLELLQHLLAAGIMTALAYLLLNSYIAVDSIDGPKVYRIFPIDTGLEFEESEIYHDLFRNAVSDITQLVALKGQLETDGILDPSKKIDVTEYASEIGQESGGALTAVYTLDDIVKWGKSGVEYTNRFMSMSEFVNYFGNCIYPENFKLDQFGQLSFDGFYHVGVPVVVGGWLEAIDAAPWVQSLILDGIIAGVGAVIGFIPQLIVLFILLGFLEGCGYMARVAFIMDRIFRRFGLSGKSFIPMLVATGCGVPGIMASRTIEQDRDRKMTIMTTGFIPCGAKMPIIALFAGALFGGSALVATSAYFIGVAAVVISGIMLKKFKAFAGEPAPFVMELPAYHAPSASNVLRSMWERGWSFIKRAGTIILLSTIILWFLSNFGFADGGFGWVEDSDASLLAAVGSVIAVIFIPLGFGNWQAAVATITGLIAKEEVVSTMQVFYPGDLIANIAMAFTAASAYSFMVFNLLCAPCFAAMGAIKREMNNAKWTWAAIGYMCGFAYVASLIVYQLGGLFTGAVTFGVWTVVALAALAAIIYLLVRKGYQGEDRSRQLSSVAAAAR